MVRIGTVELQFGFKRHTVCEAALKTFVYSVAGRIDIVVEKLEYEIVASVGYWEILCKNLVEAFVLSVFRRRVELQEVTERLELNFQKIRIWQRILHSAEVHTRPGYSHV